MMGYGAWSDSFEPGVVELFLSGLPSYEEQLQRYVPRDNSMLERCVDELIERVARGEERPDRLDSPNLGAWVV
jgi:hypothetical protein